MLPFLVIFLSGGLLYWVLKPPSSLHENTDAEPLKPIMRNPAFPSKTKWTNFKENSLVMTRYHFRNKTVKSMASMND